MRSAADAVGCAGSTKVTLALISGLRFASLSRIVTLTITVARVRSAVGITSAPAHAPPGADRHNCAG